MTPATIEKIKPILKEWLPLVKVYDSDSPKTALLNGDVDLGIVWGGEAAILYNQDKKFKYILPAEGAHRFIDNICYPGGRSAPGCRDGVHQLHPASRGEQIDLRGVSLHQSERRSARSFSSPAELANPASYPTGNPKLEIFRDIGKNATSIDKLMTDLKSH